MITATSQGLVRRIILGTSHSFAQEARNTTCSTLALGEKFITTITTSVHVARITQVEVLSISRPDLSRDI